MNYEVIEYRSPWNDRVCAVFEQPNAYLEKSEELFRNLKLEEQVWDAEKYKNLRAKVIEDWLFHAYTCSPSKEIAGRNPAYPIVILYSMFDLIQLDKSQWRTWMTDAAGFCLRYFDHQKETLGAWLERNPEEVRSFSKESQNAIHLYISCEKGYQASLKKKNKWRPFIVAGLGILLIAVLIAAALSLGKRLQSPQNETHSSLSQEAAIGTGGKTGILDAKADLMIKLRKTPGLEGEILAQISGDADLEVGVSDAETFEADGYNWIEIVILEELKSDEERGILVETEDGILPAGTVCYVASDYLRIIGDK